MITKSLNNIESVFMLEAIRRFHVKRQAAKELNISVDTINKYIEGLEQELGIKLVTVGGNGCSLTENGAKVADICMAINECMQKIYDINIKESEIKGEVRIAYDRDVRSNIYARNLAKLFQRYPQLSPKIDTYSSLPDLGDLRYDVCLSYYIPKGDDLVILAERKVPCGYFAAAEYLQKHPYPATFEDILHNHRIILKKNSNTRTDKIIEQVEKSGGQVCVSNSSFIINDMVASGVGISILPISFAREDNNLVCLDNIKCDVYKTIYLLGHRTTKDIPKIRVVIDYYKDLLKNL